MTDDPVNVERLAEVLNLDVRRVQMLAKEGVVVKEGRGAYALIPSVTAYIRYLQARAVGYKSEDIDDGEDGGGQGSGGVFNYNRERARLTRAKAEMAEIETALMKGKVHEASAVAAVCNGMLAAFRGRVLAIPTKTAPLTADTSNPVECYAIIEAECHAALSELADYDPRPVVEKIREGLSGTDDGESEVESDEDELPYPEPPKPDPNFGAEYGLTDGDPSP